MLDERGESDDEFAKRLHRADSLERRETVERDAARSELLHRPLNREEPVLQTVDFGVVAYDAEHPLALHAIEQVRVAGERWPLFAWYGVDRLARARIRKRPKPSSVDRWAGYDSSLDPALSEGPLLEWLLNEILADVVRQREGEPQRFLDKAVLEAAVRAVPGASDAW